MLKMKVVTGFRFGGTFYPACSEPVEMPAAAVKFALDYKLAEEPVSERVVDVDAAREMAMAEAKARAEAAANKSKGNAPENK